MPLPADRGETCGEFFLLSAHTLIEKQSGAEEFLLMSEPMHRPVDRFREETVELRKKTAFRGHLKAVWLCANWSICIGC